MVELAILGISLQEDGGIPLLLLHPRGTEQILSLRIGPLEAFAISTAIHGAAKTETDTSLAGLLGDFGLSAFKRPGDKDGLFPRPQTHDLLLNVIQALGGTLVSIDILNLLDGAFIAEAVIDHANGRSRVDCRPSDGIALALRCGASVRASSAVIAHAEDIDAVMASLPEYVRTIAASKLASLPEKMGRESSRLPLAIEAALTARKRFTGRASHKELLSAARQMMREEAGQDGAENAPPDRSAPSGGDAGDVPLTRPVPQIRVSLIRHKKGGEAEILDEFQIPAGGIPRDVIAGLGLSRREAEAVSAASDDERWAMLLRMLSPETKVPM